MGREDVQAGTAPWSSGRRGLVLLLLTFRSIVIPIKAIVLNLLSVGAAYAVLVLILQRGNLESLLHFKPRVPTAV